MNEKNAIEYYCPMLKERCMGNHCMLWDKQGCAIVMLSRDIRKTMQAIHKEIK